MSDAPLSAPAAARILRRRTHLLAAAAVAALALLALLHLPSALRKIDGERAELAALAPAERRLVGAYSTDVDRTFLARAKELIPPGARYYVTTGDGVEVSSPTTLAAVAPYLGYWLSPRIQVTDPHGADWIVSYGGDPGSLGVTLGPAVEVSQGLSLVPVARP